MFFIKISILAMAMTPTTTISNAKNIDIMRIKGKMPDVLMINSYQIILKCLIIKFELKI